ncbi:MAG: hypothetical protein GY755_23235, partial [Chloroflexi bacterium]|nr:hypothetical protein [Chloroflexota bacterium]
MAYTLSNLIQDGVSTLGRVGSRIILATGGSTTTAIDTKLNSIEPDYRDDDETLVRGTLIVTRTTDGLAPQGEFQRITAYSETSAQITMDAVSAAVGAGDTCRIIHSQFKLEEIIELANQALVDLGDIV